MLLVVMTLLLHAWAVRDTFATEGVQISSLDSDQVATVPGVTHLTSKAELGAEKLLVASVDGFDIGDMVTISMGDSREARTIKSTGTSPIKGAVIYLNEPLTKAHEKDALVLVAKVGAGREKPPPATKKGEPANPKQEMRPAPVSVGLRPLIPRTTTKRDQPPVSEEFVALYDYDAQESDEISFKEGDHIDITSKEGDWWIGKKRGDSQPGLVPPNYLEVRSGGPHSTGSTGISIKVPVHVPPPHLLQPQIRIPPYTKQHSASVVDLRTSHSQQARTPRSTASAGAKPTGAGLANGDPIEMFSGSQKQWIRAKVVNTQVAKFVAKFDFVAGGLDEMSFRTGDIIDFPQQEARDDGWKEGRKRKDGKVGLVPANYFEEQADEGSFQVRYTEGGDRALKTTVFELWGGNLARGVRPGTWNRVQVDLPAGWTSSRAGGEPGTGSNRGRTFYRGPGGQAQWTPPPMPQEKWPLPGEVVRIYGVRQLWGQLCVVKAVNPSTFVRLLSTDSGFQLNSMHLRREEPELVVGQTRVIHDATSIIADLNGIEVRLQEFDSKTDSWRVTTGSTEVDVQLPPESLVAQVFAVAWDYEAQGGRGGPEISLKDGDHVKIIGADRDWVKVEHMQTGDRGMFPKNHLEDTPLTVGASLKGVTTIIEGSEAYIEPGLYRGETVYAWSQSLHRFVFSRIAHEQTQVGWVLFDYLEEGGFNSNPDGARREFRLGKNVKLQFRKLEDINIKYSVGQQVMVKEAEKTFKVSAWVVAHIIAAHVDEGEPGTYGVKFADGSNRRMQMDWMSILPEEVWKATDGLSPPPPVPPVRSSSPEEHVVLYENSKKTAAEEALQSLKASRAASGAQALLVPPVEIIRQRSAPVDQTSSETVQQVDVSKTKTMPGASAKEDDGEWVWNKDGPWWEKGLSRRYGKEHPDKRKGKKK